MSQNAENTPKCISMSLKIEMVNLEQLSNMVRKFPIIREIFKGDHNVAAVGAVMRKLKQKK